MDKKFVHALGLDYRSPDRSAPPGACRTLQDVFPSGNPQRPSWVPAPGSKTYAEYTGVVAYHFWHRANTATKLVLITASPGSELDGPYLSDGIYTRQVNSNGDLMPGFEQVYAFPTINATDRDASFAQIGDTLVICTTRSGIAEDILVLSSDKGVDYCLSYNTSIDYPQVRVAQPAANATAPTGDTLIHGTYGIRLAWECRDGSLLRPTAVVYRGTLVQGEKIEVTFGQVVMDGSWDKVIKGIAVFVSDFNKGSNPPFDEALWRHAGTAVMNKSVPETLSVDMATSEFILLDEMPEDVLTTRLVRAKWVGSYNRSLLLAQAQYSLLPPFYLSSDRGDGTGPESNPLGPYNLFPNVVARPSEPYDPVKPWQTIQGVRVPSGPYQGEQTWSYDVRLTWTNPTIDQTRLPIVAVEIEEYHLLEVYTVIVNSANNPTYFLLERIEKNWSGILSDPTSLVSLAHYNSVLWANEGGLKNVFANLVIKYRIRAKYSDGKPSPWVEVTVQ